MPASSKKALLGALSANLAIAVTKFVVGAITRSTVMIAEGIHSLVDTGNSGLMLLGRAHSRRPADDAHPFGYGMELYFWSLVVAMVVFGGGGGLSIYEGIKALIHPRMITDLWPNFIVIGGAAIFETASLVIGLREFAAYRREKRFAGSMLSVMHASKDPAIFVTVLEDAAAILGLLIAAAGLSLGAWLGIPEIDGIASILIGLVLVAEALVLGVESRGLIIGEAARPIVVGRIREIAAGYPELGTVEVRTLQLGVETILVSLRMQKPVAAIEAERPHVVERLVAELHAEIPAIQDIVFELGARARGLTS